MDTVTAKNEFKPLEGRMSNDPNRINRPRGAVVVKDFSAVAKALGASGSAGMWHIVAIQTAKHVEMGE